MLIRKLMTVVIAASLSGGIYAAANSSPLVDMQALDMSALPKGARVVANRSHEIIITSGHESQKMLAMNGRTRSQEMTG